MRAIVVSNAKSLRTQYFMVAGRDVGVSVQFVTYDDLLAHPEHYADALVKLEPEEYPDVFDFDEYSALVQKYIQLLKQTDKLNLHFLNSPAAILCSLDKQFCKQCLHGKVNVTPMWEKTPQNVGELLQRLDEKPHGVFIKPRFGSGAGGVVALRRHPKQKTTVAYTALTAANGKITNTRRINRFSTRKDIDTIVEAVLKSEAVVEDWVVKDSFEGEGYDLRVVCMFGVMQHVVVRCSKGVITNLHLNNNAKTIDILQLSAECLAEIARQSLEATRLMGLNYSGVDVLIAKGTATPYIIEVNGQGDHIYQDIFAGNEIYKRQIKTT
ncbi:MAG: STM4014 family protein [Bacteroidales bacterium]|jgi:glutathione synthase/RimK-type ligase-like ATP-grasp enzyme|nr:STM4014 family protein [Bacteroidales bacterium]